MCAFKSSVITRDFGLPDMHDFPCPSQFCVLSGTELIACIMIMYPVDMPSQQVNIRDARGNSPLHIACQYGHVDIVKSLIKYNANTGNSMSLSTSQG